MPRTGISALKSGCEVFFTFYPGNIVCQLFPSGKLDFFTWHILGSSHHTYHCHPHDPVVQGRDPSGLLIGLAKASLMTSDWMYTVCCYSQGQQQPLDLDCKGQEVWTPARNTLYLAGQMVKSTPIVLGGVQAACTPA